MPEAADILYEVFGEGPRPPYPSEDSGLSATEAEQAGILQQRLLAACEADYAGRSEPSPAQSA